MKKIIRALRLKFRKIKAEAKKVGLSLPVLGLILLTFSTIITIAIAQRYRSTTLTRAELSTCKGAFYKGPSAQTNCTNACGECQECSRYGAGGYWECTGKDPDTGAISGLSSCKGNNFTYKSGCENGAGGLPGCGVGNCARCSNDGGITVRWHCGTDTGSANPKKDPKTKTQDCDNGQTCAKRDSSKYKSNTMTYLGKTNKLYYRDPNNCKNMEGKGQSLGEICGSTNSPTQNCDQDSKTCSEHDPKAYVNNNAMIFIGDDDGLIYKTEAACESKGTTSTVIDICGDPQKNLFSCSASERNCPNCENKYLTGTYKSNTRYFPSSEIGMCNDFLASGGDKGKKTIDEACNCFETVIEPENPKILEAKTCIFQGTECKAKEVGGTKYFPLEPCPKNYNKTDNDGIYHICQPAHW